MFRPVLLGVVLILFVTTKAKGASCDAKQGPAWTFLGPADLFLPPLANPKEPRFLLAAAWTSFRTPSSLSDGDSLNIAHANAGGTAGLVGYRGNRGCDGVQLELFGVVASVFNLSTRSADLLASDFIAGPQITARVDALTFRVRGYHQSSHIGDELLLESPDFEREDISFEAVDALVAYNVFFGRAYAGGGFVGASNLAMARTVLQAGLEVWGPTHIDGITVRPVLAGDFRRQQGRNAYFVKAGGEFASSNTGIRVLLSFSHDAFPYAQFFEQEHTTAWGLETQIFL